MRVHIKWLYVSILVVMMGFTLHREKMQLQAQAHRPTVDTSNAPSIPQNTNGSAGGS